MTEKEKIDVMKLFISEYKKGKEKESNERKN